MKLIIIIVLVLNLVQLNSSQTCRLDIPRLIQLFTNDFRLATKICKETISGIKNAENASSLRGEIDKLPLILSNAAKGIRVIRRIVMSTRKYLINACASDSSQISGVHIDVGSGQIDPYIDLGAQSSVVLKQIIASLLKISVVFNKHIKPRFPSSESVNVNYDFKAKYINSILENFKIINDGIVKIAYNIDIAENQAADAAGIGDGLAATIFMASNSSFLKFLSIYLKQMSAYLVDIIESLPITSVSDDYIEIDVPTTVKIINKVLVKYTSLIEKILRTGKVILKKMEYLLDPSKPLKLLDLLSPVIPLSSKSPSSSMVSSKSKPSPANPSSVGNPSTGEIPPSLLPDVQNYNDGI